MEFILIHRPRGPLPPELIKASLEFGKNVEKMVPGGKLLSSYSARSQTAIFCIWSVPNAEMLMPVTEQMSYMAWDTEVIPAEKTTDAIPKMEKALAQAMKK
jgi:hypothetical protein